MRLPVLTTITALTALLSPVLAHEAAAESSSSSSSTSTATAATGEESAVLFKVPYYPDPPKEVLIEVLYKPEGCTRVSKQGDRLHTMYNGTYTHPKSGKVITFDTTYDEEMKPFVFFLKAGQVIRGFNIGFDEMCEGEKRRIVIPPDFAYGKRGRVPHIPGWATLVFEAELVRLEEIDWAARAREAQRIEEERQAERDAIRAEHWEKSEEELAEKKKKEEEEAAKQVEEKVEEVVEKKEEKVETEDRNEKIEELGDIKDEL